MTVEARQSKLAKNAEDMERWMARLLRAAHMVGYFRAQRKRLLKGPRDKLKYRGGHPLTGIGGGAVEGLDDNLEGL